jgi:hypothetical protein
MSGRGGVNPYRRLNQHEGTSDLNSVVSVNIVYAFEIAKPLLERYLTVKSLSLVLHTPLWVWVQPKCHTSP